MPKNFSLLLSLKLTSINEAKHFQFQQIVVPPLPGKALKKQLPFRSDDGIYEDEFIENRRKGLEVFVNK